MTALKAAKIREPFIKPALESALSPLFTQAFASSLRPLFFLAALID